MLDDEALRGLIKERKDVQLSDLQYEERIAVQLIRWGAEKGMKIREVKELYQRVSYSPFDEEVDRRVLEILERAERIESEG
ncbi:MAG: hypothetical protein ACP5LW_01145 [Nitrososphaeria archaeon]